jgi:hypothetical protein
MALLKKFFARKGGRMRFGSLLTLGIWGAALLIGMSGHAESASVDWVKCADEGGTCTFSGTRTVRYGTKSSWYTKVATGRIACNNATFGDPAHGFIKECDVDMSVSPSPTPTPTPSPSPIEPNWVKCAYEGGTCTFSGTRTVRYGTKSSWYTKVATGRIACNNATFGDPAHGFIKECDVDMSVSPSPTPTPTPSPSPSPIPTQTGSVLTSSLTTAEATSFCSSKAYPAQWTWDSTGYTQTARSAEASDNLTPRIEQHRIIDGVDTIVAVYKSFSSANSCSEIWLPSTNTTGYTPAQLQTMASTGCGPFGNTPHIDLFRLWKNGDTFLVYPAVYTGTNNNIVIQPQHDIYTGQPVPIYTPDHITIQGVEQNGIRPVLYRDDKGPGDYATNMGAIYLLNSTNLTISNLDVELGPHGTVYKGLVYDNGAGYGGTDANGNAIIGTTTLRNMRISGGKQVAGGVNGIFSTTATAGTLELENIELFDNGGDNGPAHNAYLATSSLDPNFTVKMTGSWTHDAIYGHTFKSRAQRNIMIGNYFQGSVPHGGATQGEAYLLDIPNGGVLVAKDNIFVKTASGNGSNAMSITYAMEGVVDQRTLSVDIENNTFVAFAATIDGSHPIYPFYFHGGKVPGDPAFAYSDTLVSKNLYVGYCPRNNTVMDYRGDISLSAGFRELNHDFTLTNRYSSSDNSIVGTQAYKHVNQPGLVRKLATIGAED